MCTLPCPAFPFSLEEEFTSEHMISWREDHVHETAPFNWTRSAVSSSHYWSRRSSWICLCVKQATILIWEFWHTGRCKYFKYLKLQSGTWTAWCQETSPRGHAGSVKILRDILDFWGVNTCNTKKVGRLVESADATSHFVTRIKKDPENLNIKLQSFISWMFLGGSCCIKCT